MRQFGYLPELHEDAQPEKYFKISFINIPLFKDTFAISESTTINIFIGIKVNKEKAVPVHATTV